MFAKAAPRLARPLAALLRSASSVPAAKTSAPVPVPQASNFPTTWSASQKPRAEPYNNDPRFEQTALEFQPNPPSAMDMISQEPIRLVHSRKAVCDGGGGPLGHPKVFINLDKPGAKPCGYCGVRFEQAPHHH